MGKHYRIRNGPTPWRHFSNREKVNKKGVHEKNARREENEEKWKKDNTAARGRQ